MQCDLPKGLDPLLEVEPRAELEIPRGHDLRHVAPPGSIRTIHIRHGTGIQEIINVQVDIERARAEPEHLRDSQIDLRQAIFRPILGGILGLGETAAYTQNGLSSALCEAVNCRECEGLSQSAQAPN